ncbi:hypothetical protein [Enterocloster sp.]|uniref:hypothetical protein n=1 Tax=Enterocloster sp. TaxID=2719315 RepID=UPI00307EA06C
MGKQYQIQCCIRNLVYAAVAAAVVFVIRRQWNLIGISDACALSGIVFLIVGLFRRARYMRFYDLCIYGAMRFKSLRTNPGVSDKTFGSYGEFVEKDGMKETIQNLLLRRPACLSARSQYWAYNQGGRKR